MRRKKLLIIIAAILAIMGAGIFVSPSGATSRWAISPNSDEALYLSKSYSLRYHMFRSIWAVSYKVNELDTPAPIKIITAKKVSLLSPLKILRS